MHLQFFFTKIILAICLPSGCLNEGHCLAPGQCVCNNNYEGSRCGISKCFTIIDVRNSDVK